MKASDLVLKVVWGNTEGIKKDIQEFWKKEGVIKDAEILERRSEQVVLLAYNADNQIMAVSTAIKMKVKLLNDNWLYQYRCYVSPQSRVIGFDVHLTLESLKVLEESAKHDPDKPIGVFLVVENINLMKHRLHNAAVWRAYKMYFIGFNSKGQPIRVYYFKGAKI